MDADCSGSRPTILNNSEGIISSQSSNTRGCGSANSPWIISAKAGQTIDISIVDFNAEVEKSNLVSCPLIYGFVVERSLGINHTICGGRHRQMSLYTSKTNQVQIQILPPNVRGDANFLLKYKGLVIAMTLTSFNRHSPAFHVFRIKRMQIQKHTHTHTHAQS